MVVVVLPAVQTDIVGVRSVLRALPACLFHFRNIVRVVRIRARFFLCPTCKISFSIFYTGEIFLCNHEVASLSSLAVVVCNIVIALCRRHSAPRCRVFILVKIGNFVHYRSLKVENEHLVRWNRLVTAFRCRCIVEVSLA